MGERFGYFLLYAGCSQVYALINVYRVKKKRNKLLAVLFVAMIMLCLCVPLAYAAPISIDAGTTVNIPSGHSSPWDISDDLNIDGNLNIEPNGSVSNVNGSIGYSAGSSGKVTVEGDGSTWTNSRDLYVGENGAGELTIGNKGSVSNVDGFIGYNAGSSGKVTVEGDGSTWTNSRDLYVGENGAGELKIGHDAIVNVSGDVTVAANFGSVGKLGVSSGGTLQTSKLVAGVGSADVTFNAGTLRALANDALFITKFAAGKLIINAGGLTIDDNGYQVGTDGSAFSGAGGLTKRGAGILTLSGLNTYTGATTITAGTLKAGIANALSPTSAFTVNNASTLDLNGYNQTVASLTNNGIVQTGSTSSVEPVGTTLTVSGNYHGNGGVLSLCTELGDDASITDKLHVTGNTSGHTDVAITNIDGNGSQTVNGIEIIAVNGNSTGTFGNSQRIVAGAYDYFVRSGSTISEANNNNWYLVSALSTSPDVSLPAYRPETGGYLANLAASNNLFITQLHDRQRETQYADVLTGEKKVTSMWMRHVANHNSFRDSTDMLKTSGNSYVLQLGGDLAQWSNNGTDRWHFGVMGGYARNSSKSRSEVTNYFAKGTTSGYSLGLYGTWYANQVDKSGAYFDSWILYNWFDNKVEGEQLQAEKYKSKGVTASIEGGYSFLLGEDDRAGYWLQPKAQVIWTGVKADDYTEASDTRIRSDTDSNLMTRLGVRAYADVRSKDESRDYAFQPFVELNWIHNTNDYAVMMGDTRVHQKGANNLGEVKLGLEGKLKNNLTFWANINYQFGRDSYKNTIGMFGIQYIF